MVTTKGIGTHLRWCCALIMLLLAQSALANLVVQPQRQQMAVGETLGLVISSDSGLDLGQIDLSPIEQDFEILSRSSSTSISLVNGARTTNMSLNLELVPKRTGSLSIPALTLNGEISNAAQIEVSAAATVNPDLDSSRDVFLEVDVDTQTPYVQQQLRFTVKLYFAIGLSDGALSDPSSDSALIERLGQEASYRTQISGRTYQVVERQYALTPQASGPLQIPPVTLNARRSQGRGFFNRGQAIGVASRAVNLQVKPRPASYTAEPWLPARSLRLQEQLSDGPATVGEPLTRTLTLATVGLPQSLLPALEMPPTDRYQVYSDQPARNGGAQDGWLVSQMEQKIAVVPSKPGRLSLPSLELTWWDVTTDRQRTARVPERIIDVLPATGATATVTPLAPALGDSTSIEPLMTRAATQGTAAAGYWPWISALFGGLWLMTLAVLLRTRSQSVQPAKAEPKPTMAENQARKALKRACENNDPLAAEQAALALYQARGGVPANSALGLSACLNDAHAAQALMALDQRRYARDAASWDGMALLNSIDKISPSSQTRSQAANDALPALYAGSQR